MASTDINTREDLDAIAGTPEHVAFMALLAGILWRLEKDDTTQAWVAIEDNSTIGRFNFTRADFPDAQPPTLPEYEPLMTEEEMRKAEIEQDKKYLADTDWIVSKISEASLTGQDTEPLLVQYDAQIKEREMARVRIRLAEGRL